MNELDQKSLNYVSQDAKQTYVWKDLGVEYNEKEIVDTILKNKKAI